MTAHLPRGLWIVLATPFDAAGEVDHDSLAREVEWARSVPADGVVALGVFGEAAHLSLTEQRAVVETVTSYAAGHRRADGSVDVPVLGGLGGVGLVDELVMGAAGAMTGFSHPEGLRATIDAHAGAGFTAARSAWAPWLPLAIFEQQAGIALALRKMLLHRRGILAHPGVRTPAPPLPDRLVPLLEQHLAAVNDLVSVPGASSAGGPARHEERS